MNNGNNSNGIQASEEYDPYNPNNVQITKKDVENILKTYNVHSEVYNMNLYRRAFIHESYVKKNIQTNIAKLHHLSQAGQAQGLEKSVGLSTSDSESEDPSHESLTQEQEKRLNILPPSIGAIPLASKSNQRLEFLGDGILEAVAKFWIYRNFPKASEGFMTDIKINLVKNQAIGRIAQEMGLNKWMILEKSQEVKLRNNEHQMGCLFESFVGAMYLDMNRVPINDDEEWFSGGMFITGPGFQMVQLFLERVFERHVDRVRLITENNNYKRILQEKIQSAFKVTPVYVIESQPVRETGDHLFPGQTPQNVYKMGVYLCIGQPAFGLTREHSVSAKNFSEKGLEEIQQYVANHGGKGFFYLGEGENRVKKEAEQAACKDALDLWRLWV